jgi:proteic killer suppression protein
MRIRSITHRGLRRFLEDDDPRELRADLVTRIRRILSAIVLARSPELIVGPPGWRIHQLRGDRNGDWSISVSGNWRITFKVENDEVIDLNLEDYH